MIEKHLLSILIFLPLVISFVISLMPDRLNRYFKYLTVGVSVVQLLLAIIMLVNYQFEAGVNDMGSFAFVERYEWFYLELGSMGQLSASYFLGVDGLNILMIALSAFVLLIASIASWGMTRRLKGYFSLFLLLNGAVIGCFAAMDFLLFYLFFEFMLLPMYFLIGLWGGPRREYASIKFFLYTLLGSILILIVMIALYLSVIDPQKTAIETGLVEATTQVDAEVVTRVQGMLANGDINEDELVHTFDLIYMTDTDNIIPGSILDHRMIHMVLGYPARLLAFLLIFIGFAIKIPVVPLHTWLPDAHVEAPTAISVLLAGILLKVGAYGLLRTGVIVFPDGVDHYGWLMGLVGVISIIYGALNALACKDLKRLIAYSSVSHMGFVLLGIASMTVEGLSGSIYQMVSHGLISPALFIIAGVIYDRTHDRMIANYSGLASVMPRYTVFVVIFFFGSMGLPGFSGFIAEIFVLLGAFASASINQLLPPWMAITATLGLILSAAYYLWTIQRMFFGKYYLKVPIDEPLTDLNKREWVMLVPLFMLALGLGIFPHLVLDYIAHSVSVISDLIR